MRVCAAADIHYPRHGEEWASGLAREMCGSGADVIVLAGDISAGPDERYDRLLGMFADFAGPKLFVPGNHDLWSDAEDIDTRARYDVGLRHIAERSGFHYLPHSPLVVDDVGFVGTIGWYDYSFRQRRAPTPDVRVTPMRPRSEDGATKLFPVAGRVSISWEDLTDEDYEAKALLWQAADQQESFLWNDGIYVDWRASDAEATEKLVAELAADLGKIIDQCSSAVGVSHAVPFEELLAGPTDDVDMAYCRAYMGSTLLGDMFLSDPKFRLVLCGHSHSQRVIEKEHLVVANCSVAEEGAGPLLLTLPKDEPA